MSIVAPQSSSKKQKSTSQSATRAAERSGNALLLSPGARRIVQAALRENVSVNELAELASTDPAFAIRVLSVANSAAYTLSRTVTNVQQACSLLGIRGMRNIALGMLVADLVPAAEGAATLLAACLRRAVIARKIAEKTTLCEREDAFFAGLLLEVGLLHQACEHFDECVEVCRSPGRHRDIRERAVGLVPHPEMGAQIALDLSLPDAMRDAILTHHAFVRPKEPLSAVCWLAEVCAAVFETGDETQTFSLAESAAHQLGLMPVDLSQLLEVVPGEVNDLAIALDCAGGPNSQRGIRRAAERDLLELHLQYDQLIEIVARVMDERDSLRQELRRVSKPTRSNEASDGH